MTPEVELPDELDAALLRTYKSARLMGPLRRLDFRPVPRPTDAPHHCGPMAVSTLLGCDYRDVWRAFGAPRPEEGVRMSEMDRYLGGHGFGDRWFDSVPLGQAAILLGGWRYVVFVRVRRGGATQGHYATVVDRCLRDVTDTRDGMLVRAWSRRWSV